MSIGAKHETILALFEESVRDAATSRAVVTADAALTYADLRKLAQQVAAGLAQAHIGAGDRVALWLPNGIDWLAAHWGAALRGSVVVPLGTRLPPAQVRRLLEHAQVAALFTTSEIVQPDQAAALEPLLSDPPAHLRVVVMRGAARGDRTVAWDGFLDSGRGTPQVTAEPRQPDHIHLIQYTSGTTGAPKGAMLAHRGLVQAARSHAQAWDLARGEAIFVPNPFSHILGFVYGCLVPAAAGAASVTMEKFDVEPALELLTASAAVAMTGAPTHLQMLVEHEELSRFDLAHLRLAMTGGAAISPDWTRRVTKRLGLKALVNGYGMSEAGSVAQTGLADPPELVAKSVGYLMEGLEGRVVDPQTAADVTTGEPGELWIRGPAVMQGYVADDEQTASAMTPEGWLRTGDLVRQDVDGRMHFAGRLKDMFTVGGFNVYPVAVERVLEEHPAVTEAAVIATADERLGSVPTALLRTSSTLPPTEEFRAFCADKLASYEIPRRFEKVDSFPRNPTGKIDRRQLAPPSPALAPEEPTFGNYFVAAYPPFSQWSEDAVDAYRRVLENPPRQNVPLGLYCHIPFCVERCSYCYYLSHSGRELSHVDEYVSALVAELRAYADRPALAGRLPEFVYFGGGTPSLLSTSRLERLLSELQGVLPWSAVREVTFECAPRSVTVDKLRALCDAGVTRLSLGAQQLDDKVLRRNGRVHLVADIEAAYEKIRQVPFANVNLDLMVGLVGETEESLARSLDRVLRLQPDSVTVYQLEIPFNTPLCHELQSGGVDPAPATWAEKHERTQLCFQRLQEAGYRNISAYTVVRDPERHGFVYQDALYHGADLLGFGVSAFSYIQRVHHQNLAALDSYLAALSAERRPFGRAYELSHDECAVRELVLQLKLGHVELAWFRDKFGIEVLERFAEPLRRFTELGWLHVSASGIELTPEGLPRADRMLPDFYQSEHRVRRYS